MSYSATEIFENYEKELQTITYQLTQKLAALPKAGGEERKILASQAQNALSEADEVIHQLEMELMSLPPPHKQNLQPKVRGYKGELDKLKKSVREATAAAERGALLGGREHIVEVDGGNADQRARLIQGTERLQAGTQRIEEIKRVAMETEAVGINTLETLAAQREQINRTGNRLNTADSFIATSQRILKGMQRRIMQNKVMTVVIIMLLVALIIAIVYIKWVPKG